MAVQVYWVRDGRGVVDDGVDAGVAAEVLDVSLWLEAVLVETVRGKEVDG